jgi:hypothetical protein
MGSKFFSIYLFHEAGSTTSAGGSSRSCVLIREFFVTVRMLPFSTQSFHEKVDLLRPEI